MKNIAVITSGGDAPGMNAAVRAVVRMGLHRGLKVWGVRHGYTGLIQGSFTLLGVRDVGGIIQQGGTFLGTSRCSEFKSEAGPTQALEKLRQEKIDALVVIGGNGSQAGAHALSSLGFPVVGVASTIDNDLYGSERSIGVDTALNVALEAIDRLKVTASSHQRAFLVEVMGRDTGHLAVMAGVAGGAEAILVPEVEVDPWELAEKFRDAYRRGKSHALAVVAEGARFNAAALAVFFQEHHAKLGFDLRATILGHVQRGAAPSGFDRLLATRLGVAAVESLCQGKDKMLMAWSQGRVVAVPLAEVAAHGKPFSRELLDLADALER